MNLFQPLSLQSSTSEHKRKRSLDDASDEELEHHFKHRRTFPSLPIRSPPRLRSTFDSPFSTFNPPAPLTPIDTSEDESLPDDHRNIRVDDLVGEDSQGSRTSNVSTSSMMVNIDPTHDSHVATMLPPPARPRFGRARSNDLVSPAHLSTSSTAFLSPHTPNQVSDRVPTPVASHFDSRIDSRLSTLPSAPRHSFPPLRQFLSPMMEQDGWGNTTDGGLPSPASEDVQYNIATDADVMMGYEQTSDGLGGLCLDEDKMMEDSPTVMSSQQSFDDSLTQGHTHSRNHSRGGSIAKLHMGYLSGCQKCEQKVPGHYSHILRS